MKKKCKNCPPRCEGGNKCSRKAEISKRNEFFLDIWRKNKHICENCGKWLGNEPLSYHFDHLLEKNKFPELKFEEFNIFLTCLDCHSRKTNGFISEIVQNRINQVKLKFNIL